MNKYWLGALVGAILMAGVLSSTVLAKKISSGPTIICQPTMDSKDLPNDVYAESNCDYIYGKLDYMDKEIQRLTSYITNIHSDLEIHSGINTPLNPN